MANITLADIRNAADKKYGHTEIDLGDGNTVTLVNALRLSKDKRATLLGAADRLKGDGGAEVDQFAAVADTLRAAAKTEGEGEMLIDALDGDLALAIETMNTYMEGTQAGEA